MRSVKVAIWLGVVGMTLCGCGDRSRQGLAGGYQSLEQREYDKALAAADEYLKKHPTGDGAAEAQYLKGRALEQRTKSSEVEMAGNLKQAIEAYNGALRLKPSRQLEGLVQAGLGNANYWLGEYEEAEEHFQKAHAIVGDDVKPWILYRVALCRQRQGKWSDADETFAKVIEQHPGSEAAQRAAAHKGARAFFVQLAAFQSVATADKLVTTLKGQGYPAGRYEKRESGLQVVMAGPYQRYEEAAGVKGRLAGQFKDAMIVP